MSETANAQNLYADGGAVRQNVAAGYSELARELSAHNGIVVGVMNDPRFAGQEVPPGLRFEPIATAWETIPGVRVVSLDADQIRSHAILFKGKMDILVYPYGSVYPMDAYSLFSGQTFNYFLRQGGAVLTSGGIPFANQASPYGKHMENDTLEKLTEVFDKWISKFGIKYYQCRVPPAVEHPDSDLLPDLKSAVAWMPSSTGVVIVNSAHDPVPRPPSGNVFPERTPARTVLPLLRGFDHWGQKVCISAALSQDFENGSRRIHFTHVDGAHPLAPEAPHFPELMQALFGLLANRVFVKDVEAGYACYRQGEEVALTIELASFEPEAVSVTMALDIADAAGVVAHHAEEQLQLPPGRTSRRTHHWHPARFASDEYTVRVRLLRDGRAVSKAANGFVVWNEDVIRRGPRLGIKGHYLTVNDQPTVITGTNYYESTRGEAMWFRPDVAHIIRDHRQMQACGVNMIRPHYHHLKWFRDYLLYHHGRLPDFYRELESGVGAMPDERVWRIWDLFIYLGQKYGIVYNGDLFTLVPEEMGDPRGWYGTVEAVYDRRLRPAQKEFLLALDRRYRQVPGISWDLFNEPYMVTDEAVAEWAGDLGAALAADGSPRLLTVGGVNHLPSGVDYDSIHGRISPSFRHTSTRPVLLQELHFDRPEHLPAELQQAEGFRTCAVTTLLVGAAGWMPWSWTRQMRLWQDSYEHHHTFPMEKWDDRLGMHTHEDGTLKPAGLVFKDLAVLLAGIRPVSHDPETCRTTTTVGTLTARLATTAEGSHEILHVAAGRCLAAMSRDAIAPDGRPLVTGPAGAYLFLRAPEDGFWEATEVLIKSELPGTLVAHRGGAIAVELVDPTPSDCRLLDTVGFSGDTEQTCIEVTGGMTSYWLRLRFRKTPNDREAANSTAASMKPIGQSTTLCEQ